MRDGGAGLNGGHESGVVGQSAAAPRVVPSAPPKPGFEEVRDATIGQTPWACGAFSYAGGSAPATATGPDRSSPKLLGPPLQKQVVYHVAKPGQPRDPRRMTTTTLPTVRHHWVSVKTLRLHAAEVGSDGPPVLMLHGFPQHWYAWRHVMAALADDHRVYALDLRGAGRSDAPHGGYDTLTMTGDVLAVMDALELPVVHLAGHESGAWLGFHLALAAPERVASLLAVNTLHPWLPLRRLAPQMWRFWYTALFEYPVLGEWVIRTRPGVLRWLLRRGRRALPDVDVDVFVDVFRDPARARAGQQLQWQLVVNDIPRRIFGRYRSQRLTVPTMLLAGRRDFAVSPRSLTQAGSNATELDIQVVDGGHYLPEERPDVVAASIRGMTSGAPPLRRPA